MNQFTDVFSPFQLCTEVYRKVCSLYAIHSVCRYMTCTAFAIICRT